MSALLLALAVPHLADTSATPARFSGAEIPGAVPVEAATPWFGPADDDAAVVAACPSGTVPVDGDARVEGDGVVLVLSAAEGDVWRAEVVRTSPSAGAWRITLSATCVPQREWLRHGQRVEVVQAGMDDVSAVAACPAGSRAVGGGGRVIRGADYGASLILDDDARSRSAAVSGVSLPVTVGAQATCWRG